MDTPALTPSTVAAAGQSQAPVAPTRREDSAAELRARLLRMIVDNQQSRRTAAVDAKDAR
jgi:hypothetical protein